MAEPDEGTAAGAVRAGWPTWAENWVSLLVAVHLTALVVGTLAAPPMSMLEWGLARLFRPYFGLLDHGYSYHFYAPEPTPTVVVLATLRFKDGSEKVVRVPDWRAGSRLTHQRHMALANTLYMDREAARRGWARHRDDRWARSYARHLGLLYRDRGCVAVSVAMQLHLIPELDRARHLLAPDPSRPLDLDAGEFFTAPETIGEYQCADF